MQRNLPDHLRGDDDDSENDLADLTFEILMRARTDKPCLLNDKGVLAILDARDSEAYIEDIVRSTPIEPPCNALNTLGTYSETSSRDA